MGRIHTTAVVIARGSVWKVTKSVRGKDEAEGLCDLEISIFVFCCCLNLDFH